ncbi:PHD finger protein ALFIN-LIKE 3-like isoform X2 [Miscanthus floridulus]|uniref:PHD finger protein ALFIN-LIKE 3-like isoform X2 n=1 Tax=Miscanthus floridulus TaxID=154761 RepID=UPI003459CA17
MDSPPPLLASSPRSALPDHPQHGQATGSPPPALLTSAPCSPLPAEPLLHGQATGAPMETHPPAPAAAAFCPPSYTAEWIFRDFACRRAALFRALTSDEKALSRKCNQGTETLYLYGNSDGSWEVRPQKLFMPLGQPEPTTLGIKLVRGNMKRTKWLRHIAMHCDAWLIRISSFLGANLETRSRQRLSDRMNSLQTVLETLIASDTYRRICSLEKMNEDEDEGCGTEPTICASCGSGYHANGFWICCDVCDRWFHGKCVKITAAQAERIEHYECPECCSDKKGHGYNVDPMLSVLYKRY